VQSPKTSAEKLIDEYFDRESRVMGLVISREGAGRFQLEVLKDIFVVTGVSNCKGAYIFDGRPIEKDPSKFSELVKKRFEECTMQSDVKYTIIMNELYPNFDQGLEQAAIDTLTGTSPAVVVFPQSWNSTLSSVVTDPGKVLWRNVLTYSTLALSTFFAATCYDPNSVNPIDLPALASMPIAIQSVAQIVETVTAKAKGVKVTSLLVPTTSSFTYGTRSTFLNMASNRNDIFDISAVSVGSTIVTSITALFIGLTLTVSAPADVLATYPMVPYSFLQIDSLVSQLVSYELPGLGLLVDANSNVHLHWLAISGAFSLLATTFQLLPLDNSAGSKMSFACLGRENFSLLTLTVLLIKFGLVGAVLLNFNSFFFSDPASSLGLVTKQRLLFDYILASQFAGDASENQIAVDNLSELSEGRRFLFIGFVIFLFYSFFPFTQVSAFFSTFANNLLNGPQSSLF